DWTEALRRARQAKILTKHFTDPYEIAAIRRLRGIIKIARGHQARGIELLQSAWAQFSKVGANLEAKVTAQLLARATEQDGQTTESAAWRRLGGERDLPTLVLLLPRQAVPKPKPVRRFKAFEIL